MALVELIPQNRSQINDFLRGDRLGRKFHELFDSKEDIQKKKNEKKKNKKKTKTKPKDKKAKRDKSPETAEVLLPVVELAGNPSSFNVYAHVRQTVLEDCMKEAVKVYQKTVHVQHSDTDTEEEQDDRGKEPQIKIPKIVGIGLNGVFELIRETCQTLPELCVKALQALLDMLQGQHPESMKSEPTDVIDSMYQLLIDIAKGHNRDLPPGEKGRQLSSLSCAALISLAIARGDTGKLLTAVAAMLISPPALSMQQIQVPYILISLQRSIQAVLLGKTQLPDWLSCGVKEKALRDTFNIKELESVLVSSSSIASDGTYLYIHNRLGLVKVGTGCAGTIKGHVYARNKYFQNEANSWLSYAAGKIYFKDLSNSDGQLSVICTDSLNIISSVHIEGGVSPANVLFSDGEHIGQVAATKDESFVVRTYTTDDNPMTVTSEVPLKLARKCLDTFGASPIDDQVDIHAITTGLEEDINSIASGKEFALIRTASGKVLYSGKSQSLGIKQGGPSRGKWAELSITKSPKINQIAVGHDGQHALMVADDGAVFFVGTPKRGEDGDSSVSKARRQLKPLKPKKMIKLETKTIVYAACNNGSSALVSKEGQLYMFGKDTSHCDQSTGQVTDVKDVIVTQVALGKAHAVILSNKGRVYTFGINNKGQCGRDYNPGVTREIADVMTSIGDEEEDNESEDMLCPPGKHKWKTNQCMVCTVCGECTGYGNRCINSGSSDRNPGLPCLCGAGDSGCSECGCCKTCAGEQVEERELIDEIYKSKDVNIFKLIVGRHRAQQIDQLSKKLDEKKKSKFKGNLNPIQRSKSNKAVSEPVHEAEPESSKLTSLPPAPIQVGLGDVPVTQIACGLHHTVLLLQDGSVYSFGSNQYGQLGLGDTLVRGVPTRVHLLSAAVQIAAGSHHTVILLVNGQVLTCGNLQKGSLGRSGQDEGATNLGAREKTDTRFSLPGVVPCVGAMYGRRATWIGASGDQTFLRVDESLINAHTLAQSNMFANQSCIGLIPTREEGGYSIKCLVINKQDGSCKSFSGTDQVDLANHATCLDPAYDVLWSYCSSNHEVKCYNVISAEATNLQSIDPTYTDIFTAELAIPIHTGSLATRSHCALNVLACIDTHTTSHHLNMAIYEEEREKQTTAKVFSKEDFFVVNRFDSHGGGWGYSGHSIEAIRFMVDVDVLLGGFGLFGGRGEYYGRIKVFDLGSEGGENEADGELIAETEEMPYECGAREKYAMLFDEPVPLQANTWYVAWARISGPSSDCGSSGQSVVTTEEQVVFKFKSSKKSNNGTDVNAGQIPQILYRLPTHDSPSGVRKSDQAEPAHILTTDFSRSVSVTCFDSLLKLLGWSWKTFSTAIQQVNELKDIHKKAAISDLERLVYISTASLRLLRIYITDVYPAAGGQISKVPVETVKIAECVGNSRELLREVLSEGQSILTSNTQLSELQEEILTECHRTFTACFHAFYPTESLKWVCLCDLLSLLEPNSSNMDGYGRLLAAIMEAMCHPSVKLTNIFPINCEHETEELLRRQSVSIDDNTNSASRMGYSHHYPLLVSHMMYRTASSGGATSHCSFKEILDRLLFIVTLPIRQEMVGDCPVYPSLLVANTCSLLATIVSELSSAALGSETEGMTATRPMLTTPNRFTRTSPSAYWNTGNGSPDSVAFTVDRPGIVIAGVCLYGGGGQYDYDLEILDESEGHGDTSHSHRWNSLEVAKGSYSVDSLNEVAEIKFDRPVTVKENTKYALRLRNHGPRTLNGDGGMSKVKCPDGATFTFSACSLSINGTNHMRGQIPQILYYSAPQDGESSVQNNKLLAEQQARKNAINITSAICRAAKDILHRAQPHAGADIGVTVGKSHLFSSLLPLVLAYIGPVAAQDSRGAVHVLSLVQDVLPAVSLMNSQLTPQVTMVTAGPTNANEPAQSGDYTTSQHFAIIESEHPYKPATVANYKVSFPETVKWLVIEFDPQCGTAQPEDSLQLYVPSLPRHITAKPTTQVEKEETDLHVTHWPILKRFSGTLNWPKQSVILPGNEVIFSLETASDYVKDEKTSFYGFKASVTGYESNFGHNQGVEHLEKELSFLGGMCASSLMRQDVSLPPASLEELDEDLEQTEEGAQLVFNAHSNLLSQGFALSHPPSIGQALEGNLPFCWQSNERAFLKDFVTCTPGTSGGRLARWLQPDSYLDPKQCDILYKKEEVKCSWPVVITVQTKDQYGHLVNVSNLRVDVRAVPIDQKDDSKKIRRLSRPDDGDLTFGGHPPPSIDIPYEVTIKDKKDAFHAISMMKPYENYSFEELRYAAPSLPRPSENMLVRTNNDGTYTANWTPGSVGFYNIHVTVDGFEAGDGYKVEVKEPPQGMTPPTLSNNKLDQPNKMRRFIGKHSAGLRIRSNPSLQSEQTGVIAPAGIISFIDEVHNADGIWVRLNLESIGKWCSNGYTEGWALQYNQHLAKTLLVPVEEAQSLEELKDNPPPRLPDVKNDSSKTKEGGPGVYHLIRCGSSGHNIRCGPSRKSRPIGMLVLGNTVTATEDLQNADGTWVKLDQETVQRYCHEIEGEAWSLSRALDETVYLEHETDLSTTPDTPKGSPFSLTAVQGAAAGSPSHKGFDFRTAQHHPSFSIFTPSFEVPSIYHTGPMFGRRASTPANLHHLASIGQYQGWSTIQGPVFHNFGGDNAGASGPTMTFTPHTGVPGVNYYHKKMSRGSEGSITPLPKHNHLKAAPVRAATMGSYMPQHTEKLFERKDIPPELQGVSVKELVKALGESRANANGPTPVPSPPGTPKKSLSRSSSPKSDMDISKRLSPRPESPQRSDSPSSKSHRSDSPSSKSHRSDSPSGSISSKSESPAKPVIHGIDSSGIPPRPERTDKLQKSDRSSNANHPSMMKPSIPYANCHGDDMIVNNYERVEGLETNHCSPVTTEQCKEKHTPYNHIIEDIAQPVDYYMTPTDIQSIDGDTHRTKGRLTREMSFETPPLTPPSARKDISGDVSPNSPRTVSPVCQARGASGGVISPRTQSPSAGGSHGHVGGDNLDKPAFNIGTINPKDDPSRSPKAARKSGRGRQLRSKRDRASSPSSREATPVGRSLLQDRGHECVKEALSPSVAECLRAVFAAFLWHEGIVHDAMACASFLKFNQQLSKEMSKFSRAKTEEKDRVRMRHPTDTTHNRGKENKTVENINMNINESFCSLHSDQARDNNEANDKATGCQSHTLLEDNKTMSPSRKKKTSEMLILNDVSEMITGKGLLLIDKESQLPPTLHHLVYFWEELSSAILKVVIQDLIIPSPAANIKMKKVDKKDRDKEKEKKSKKRRDLKPMSRGNLFGEAAGPFMFGHAGGGGGGDRETMCELCGGMFPHPVTYHMRQVHPGCGRHACGKGYNSGGNFCGGWAGNCGEGGMEGSSWYLMCDKCREKYLREKKHNLKEKDRNQKKKKKSLPKEASVMSTLESHIVLKNNAMFLLELASAAGISIPVQSHKKRHGAFRTESLLPSVSEDGASEVNPFPPIPFQYLQLRGAQACDSAFAEEIFVDQEERVFVRSGSLSSGSPKRTGYRPRLPTEPPGGLSRASSMGQDNNPLVRVTPLSPPDQSNLPVVENSRPIPKSAGTSPDTEQDQGRRAIFQRSISEMTENNMMDANSDWSNRMAQTRRRNNSGGVGDGGTSLLKYPSAAMSKLIASVDKLVGNSILGEKALQRPVLAFIIQRHDLDGLQLSMRQAVRKAACRVYAMQALNWLIRVVTHPTSLHDLLWFFVSSLLPPGEEEEEDDNAKEKKDKKDLEDKDIRVCEHPLSDITIAGKASHPLQPTFHNLLQTIADVMMHIHPGSSLQQMAVRCYCLKFHQSDHQFLHESHVFSNISRILTKSDEEVDESQESSWTTGKVTFLKDLTSSAEVKASSRQAMVASLSDNSTETFWESGDEDRNKTKMITIICGQRTQPKMVYVHIDNSRDLGNKVSSIQFWGGTSIDELKKYKQMEIEARHIGWISCVIVDTNCRYLRLEVKGPDNNLRLRQIKVLGEEEGESLYIPAQKGALVMQQNNCEAETLKVFRLLTSQVFGKLLFNGISNAGFTDNHDAPCTDNDLKEHMVGILFSRSKLSHLQKQVCAHIVQAIRKETERVKEEWEAVFSSKTSEEENRLSDVYCFELLSMVLALSGSGVGRAHLAQQYGLLQDLFTLLHTATPRVQRQVVSVLRRVLPEVQPEILATILKVDSLPPADFSIVTASSREQGDVSFNPDKVGIIDVFLACIAKTLTVQTKVKSSGGHKGVTTVSLAESLSQLPSIKSDGVRWWLRGKISGTLTSSIIQLLQDMAAGKLSEPWAGVTKGAIAEAILALTKLDEAQRVPQTCIQTPTLWLALASLCVLDREHVERLSSGEWAQDGQHGQPRPTCDNHDDNVTQAIILCNECGNLCADCDRFLHLHRKKRSHQRQVFKEEEEAIKVDLHEGCGRTKLFWVMALADSKTLKAMVEFREGQRGLRRSSSISMMAIKLLREGKVSNPPGGPGTCRFCATSSNTGLLAIGNVCADPDCQENARNACAKVHPCGHPCGGIKNEEECLPCLHRCRSLDQERLKQDADDMCMICFTEALAASPAIQLQCGHVFHMRCCQKVLEKGWVGPRITFGFSLCPICKSSIKHSILRELLDPISVLHEDVKRKALMRLEYEGLHKAEAITTPGARFHNDPAGFAMDRYAYYVCYKCKKAYYGGEVRCDEQAGGGDDYNPQELVCGGCSDVSRAQMCPKHGTDFLEYKCRYCCSVAVFFCFGTTHFCNACHDDFQRVTNIPKPDLPHCPAGSRGKQLDGEECPLHVQHPPTGEEFALGCGVCRNAHTF